MNTPVTFGWLQIVLLLLLIGGVVLFISSAMGLVGRARYDDDDDYARPYAKRRRRRRGLGWKGGIGGLVLLGVAVLLIWLAISVQSYLGLTGEIQVAQIRATSFTNQPHAMNVELTLYDQNGHASAPQLYNVQGDEWMLQGDIVKFPSWLNILGLHSGYKLTRLEGRFDDPEMERKSEHTVVELNGGDDNFFKTVQEQAWVSPIVEAAYGNAVFLKADGKTYNIFVSQTGLLARPAR